MHLCGCSERLDRSMVEDMRKREACSINQSLSALGDVFAALSSKTSHVPYRNSKLTYLLQVRRRAAQRMRLRKTWLTCCQAGAVACLCNAGS